jgi:nicotinamidase/pyrazinamidase
VTEAISDRDVLLLVDIQNDFCPGGALAVPRGDEIVPAANRLATRFQHVVLTQDWHPRGHLSFASTHPGTKPYETVELAYGTQVLWPDHCIQGTGGADFRADLDVSRAELVLRKGYHREIDSYSVFVENDRKTATGLAGYLRERCFTRVFIAGWLSTSASAFRPRTAIGKGSRSWSLRTPVAALMSPARWRRHGTA